MITEKTTLLELQTMAHDVRDWPSKPTSIAFKFFGHSRHWDVTICMIGGPVIGHGATMWDAVNDAMSKAQKG